MAPVPAVALFAGALFGCGGGGGGPVEPGGEAVLTAPSFSTSPSEIENVDLRLRSTGAAAALQVDVVFPGTVVPIVEGVAATGRAAGLEGATLQNLAPGRARVLLFDPDGGASLPAGDGPVLTLSFTVVDSAPAGTFPVALEGGLVVDRDGEPLDLELEPGQVTVER